jgi:ArsR family transcriptional regulator
MAKHQDIRPEDVVGVARALDDLTRLRALYALSKGELCVCQITELAGLAPSTVSRHMAVLQSARLVTSRKDGRWVYYRLAQQPETDLAASALEWALRAFGGTDRARRDARELKKIKQGNPEELCRRQRKG